MSTLSIPEGFLERRDWRIHTNGKEIVILGDPGDGEDSEDENAHNCDAMGCCWEHVLFRFDVPSWQKVPPAVEPDKMEHSFAFVLSNSTFMHIPGPLSEAQKDALMRVATALQGTPANLPGDQEGAIL